MKHQFKQGDIVRLVSGGPDMTIHGVHYDVLANEYVPDMFDCIWFAEGHAPGQEAHYGPFTASELILVKECEV